MSHRRLWISAAIITAIVVSGFILFVPHAKDVAQAPTATNTAPTIPPITIKDVFKKGVHTISGAIETPNACSTVTAMASTTLDTAGITRIQLHLTITPDEDDVCLQLPAIKNFSTTITAPAGAAITATVNGTAATTTIL